jgi:DNA modification methylase
MDNKPDESYGALVRNFIEPPFSVLDARSARWRERKSKWLSLGIKSETGRDTEALIGKSDIDYMPEMKSSISIFDPVLCELMYKWFCPKGGSILDPFAGGSVRGVVASKLGYKYTGIELREEQVNANREQANEIINSCYDREDNNITENKPVYICGSSNVELNKINDSFDFIFSCPPYVDLEVYSDDPEDLSNMDYESFIRGYKSIISKSVDKLKRGHFAVFVVGDVRDKDGYYYDFISDTKKAFIECGAKLYNEAVLLDPIGTAMIRANATMATKKLVKVHQNVLCFKKDGNIPNDLKSRVQCDYVKKCDECGGKIVGHYCEDCIKEFR